MAASSYYDDKLDVLADLFGTDVTIHGSVLHTRGVTYPIVDDVIVLLPPAHYPPSLRPGASARPPSSDSQQAPGDLVQFGFSAEWTAYPEILPEHRDEFAALFDLIALESLRDTRVCDLGCGIGRWASFVAPYCRELVLVDFSDAIFVARRNLAHVPHALFFLGDVTALPFRRDFAGFAFCTGVLHHLEIPALHAVRIIATYAPRLLVYLYYALDNRPWHYRALFTAVDAVRRRLCRIRDPRIRRVVAWLIALTIYEPLVGVGHLFDAFGHGRTVPLFETYRGKTLGRIEQDAYDRFFTAIEQRVSRREVVDALSPFCGRLTVSDRPPYWHFLCERAATAGDASAGPRQRA